MKINIEFIKLLLIAILCDFLILASIVLIEMNIEYRDYNSAMNTIGFTILWFVSGYVHQHELKRKLKYIASLLDGSTIHIRR